MTSNAEGRPFCATERGVDACDRMASLSFTVVARVRGDLPSQRLQHALDRLERRHPLLRAGIVRGAWRLDFRWGAAAPIPLQEREAPPDRVAAEAEFTLRQRPWTDEGPRAELLVLRHGVADCSLLLTLHHLISDGSSGILLMRDLLAVAAGEALALPEVIDSPGLNAFVPARWTVGKAWPAMLQVSLRSLLRRAPLRLRQPHGHGDRQRALRLNLLQLPEPVTQALCARARRDGLTVHGIIAAAMSQGLQACASRDGTLRIMHAVNMRKQLSGSQRDEMLSQACGYYVSGIQTDHCLRAGVSTADLARDIHAELHGGLARGEPWLVLPGIVPMLTALVPRRGDVRTWAWPFERLAFRPGFGITNLGRLEALQCRASVGALQVDSLYFCAAGSVLYELGLSVTHFQDRLTLALNSLRARLTDAQAAQLLEYLEAGLRAYAEDAATE